jgi:predicted deacylase
LTIDLPITKLYTNDEISVPVHVVCGKRDGPRLFITAAIHGDEINGVEIIRRLLKSKSIKDIRGTLVAVPIVNVHGFLHHSRYLPDGRDLNRSFPGSKKGSLAARLAHIMMREIVNNCTHGIDLHTGARERCNLPHIRANLDHEETNRLAHAFAVPVIMNSNLRDGSLREATSELDIPMLLYEAGEALRFDELSIRAGVQGIRNVMRALGMLPPHKHKTLKEPFVARSSHWIRASASGIFTGRARLGDLIRPGQRIGVISDPFGENEVEVVSPFEGIIVGRSNLPLANEGDALLHIARFDEDIAAVADQVEDFQATGNNV